ncbi:toxic anion resistance protein [Staphylococcus saprophyticus]|uniref:toxic anion resistance protein n=3 Tax=Staphylococcus saprophyticus TaxID=29385 RepID=UPI0008537BA7|nr:toxic anion resistance protein [Staphylococcus saprophyticus]MDT3918120.1 toxic anion resistance protein [Staphylococcus saprophyticus]MDT3977245.1 toxic anion resistance protein [Staphylococcus saprophyticus]MDT3986935.1 toxic anion resistance protein [Staphylococcus saprophyticus]MDT3996801.1 toxic anion resistance protein [Staphylococcus saprophyticus]MDW4036928.1 toxic anion resistance protein [Staphylococcus saprophyticus]
MAREQDSINSHPLDKYIDENSANGSEIIKSSSQFSHEDQQKIDKLSKQIKPMDNDGLLNYGTEAQSNMSQFSHRILNEVKTTDVGPVGDSLNGLMSKLKSVNPEELNSENQSKLKRIFKRTKASVNEIFSKMQSVGSQIDRISIELDKHKNNLKKDIDMLDELYDMNKDYFDELSLYIEAAKHKQYVLQQDEIPKLREQAKSTGNQMDVQAASDMEQFVDRLDKRIYDLQLSRQIAIQTAPQIRMIQNVNQALAEKIQSSILTSIPLWKNQMSIALTLMRQRNAVSAQKAVTDTTNDLLLKNSELLKQNALATATENERGVVDIETLKTTQKDIIETIEQTLQIQEQGRTKRKQAESELNELETELQNQLLDMKENK